MHILNRATAAQFINHIVNEFKKFNGKLAHGNFSFLPKIDELSLDPITRGTPFIFFDKRTPVYAVAHVAGVKAMQLDHDGLSQRRDSHRLLYLGSDITHPEFQRAKRRVRTNIPPDFLAAINAVELHQQIKKVLVCAPGFKLLRYARSRETAKNGRAER